jgi:hypothetical protein
VHQGCNSKTVYVRDRSGMGVWLPANREEGGCWKLLICDRCRYCLISDCTESCPRCYKKDMRISHRKNNGVIDGFMDSPGPLTRLAMKLFWDQQQQCCFACRVSFPSSWELLSHLKAMRLSALKINSKWVFSKLQTHRTKCTGMFVCCHCLLSGRLTVWKDKFAYRDYGQLCIFCNSGIWIKPVMMWQGTSNISRPVYDVSEHETARCEACFLNKCVYVARNQRGAGRQ